MKKIKEFLKEVRSDKRKKGLFSLGLWFLFFVFVFLLLGNPRDSYENYYKQQSKLEEEDVNNTKVQLLENSLENYNNMSNYEFSYNIDISINNINKTHILTGTFYDNKYYLEMNNIKYYIDGNNIYIVDINNKLLKKISKFNVDILDISTILKDNLYTMIKSSEEISSKSYVDKSIVREYLYKNYNNKTINISFTEKDKLINKVIVDYKNYFDSYQNFMVTINFDNINNINEYTVNYDDYTIIEEGV